MQPSRSRLKFLGIGEPQSADLGVILIAKVLMLAVAESAVRWGGRGGAAISCKKEDGSRQSGEHSHAKVGVLLELIAEQVR